MSRFVTTDEGWDRATSTSGVAAFTVVCSTTPASGSVRFTVASAPTGSATRRVTGEKPLRAAATSYSPGNSATARYSPSRTRVHGTARPF